MSMKKQLTHIDSEGQAHMVDISAKPETVRYAKAMGVVFMDDATLKSLQTGDVKKGDVLSIARIAGIMAAKRTSDLIPLCHPIPISSVSINLQLNQLNDPSVLITATVQTTASTGVEMEALTAVSVTALTIYDMLKAIDRSMCITNIRLVEKRGGQSSDYHAEITEEK